MHWFEEKTARREVADSKRSRPSNGLQSHPKNFTQRPRFIAHALPLTLQLCKLRFKSRNRRLALLDTRTKSVNRGNQIPISRVRGNGARNVRQIRCEALTSRPSCIHLPCKRIQRTQNWKARILKETSVRNPEFLQTGSRSGPRFRNPRRVL
jgi:hypothetical protein